MPSTYWTRAVSITLQRLSILNRNFSRHSTIHRALLFRLLLLVFFSDYIRGRWKNIFVYVTILTVSNHSAYQMGYSSKLCMCYSHFSCQISQSFARSVTTECCVYLHMGKKNICHTRFTCKYTYTQKTYKQELWYLRHLFCMCMCICVYVCDTCMFNNVWRKL